MKDYNPRVPFSKTSRPLQRAAPSPFMPLTVGLHTASIALNTMTYASAPIAGPPSRAHASSSAVASKNTFRNAAPPPNQISGDEERQFLEFHGWRPTDQSTISSSSSETVEISRKRLKDVAGDVFAESRYDQNYPPGESSAAAYSSAPSKSTMQVGLPIISTPPKLTMLTFQPLEAFQPHSSSSLGQSSMISDQWTQPLHSSDSSASATTSPQTTGVKRRLGMGRSATGYSNKKFKPPA